MLNKRICPACGKERVIFKGNVCIVCARADKTINGKIIGERGQSIKTGVEIKSKEGTIKTNELLGVF